MPRILNERYNEFFKKGSINTISPEQFLSYMKRINHKQIKQARNFFSILYYTGARPAEILDLKAKDITKEGLRYVIIQMPGKKNGLPRPIRLPYRRPYVKEIYQYAIALFEEQYLFPSLRSNKIRTTKWVTSKGEHKSKDYEESSCKIWYHFDKWFDGEINPYFLRHNRFSKLMEAGGTAEQVRSLKGAKSMESTTAYMHLSKKQSVEIAKKID